MRLRERILTLGLTGKVELLGRISEDDLVEHLARCRAVCFAPRSEDYGFVTLQAFRSAKAVVTASDSGGPTELVRDGKNGFVVEPNAEAIARSLDRLGSDIGLAEELGRQAALDARAHTWENTVERLVGGAAGRGDAVTTSRAAGPSSKT
jgi:glycosyltransferase involved in cell wall biosynthesis